MPANTKFAPDSYKSVAFTASGGKPIFFYASLPQAQREFSFYESEDECDGIRSPFGGCLGVRRLYTWQSNYWAFYRAGIKRVGTELRCGWITVGYGCNYTQKKERTVFFVNAGGNSGQGGTWPYSNETLNLIDAAVIVADGKRYD